MVRVTFKTVLELLCCVLMLYILHTMTKQYFHGNSQDNANDNFIDEYILKNNEDSVEKNNDLIPHELDIMDIKEDISHKKDAGEEQSNFDAGAFRGPNLEGEFHPDDIEETDIWLKNIKNLLPAPHFKQAVLEFIVGSINSNIEMEKENSGYHDNPCHRLTSGDIFASSYRIGDEFVEFELTFNVFFDGKKLLDEFQGAVKIPKKESLSLNMELVHFQRFPLLEGLDNCAGRGVREDFCVCVKGAVTQNILSEMKMEDLSSMEDWKQKTYLPRLQSELNRLGNIEARTRRGKTIEENLMEVFHSPVSSDIEITEKSIEECLVVREKRYFDEKMLTIVCLDVLNKCKVEKTMSVEITSKNMISLSSINLPNYIPAMSIQFGGINVRLHPGEETKCSIEYNDIA